MDRLPLRADGVTARLLGGVGHLVVLRPEPGMPSRLGGQLTVPAVASAALLLRVHSSAGIPLASARVQLSPGAHAFESGQVTFLGLEGYAHLTPEGRRQVEERMWSRCAFVSAEPDAGAAAAGRT